jgi:hypothetical protein
MCTHRRILLRWMSCLESSPSSRLNQWLECPYRSSRKEPDLFVRSSHGILPSFILEVRLQRILERVDGDMNLLLVGGKGEAISRSPSVSKDFSAEDDHTTLARLAPVSCASTLTILNIPKREVSPIHNGRCRDPDPIQALKWPSHDLSLRCRKTYWTCFHFVFFSSLSGSTTFLIIYRHA